VANRLSQIKYVVQLMLENRSFDQMLGFLYSNKKAPSGAPFEGLTGNENNLDDTGRSVSVYPIQSTDSNAYLMPGADPGEGYYNTNLQLFSTQAPTADQAPTNGGFVVNFKGAIASDEAKGYTDTLPGTQPSQIMGMYSPATLPVLSALAKGYAVCDQWFASVPTQTIPNRAFAGAATSQGRLDNNVKTFTCDSIYGRLSAKNVDWAIYGYSGSPMTRTDFPDTLHAAASKFGKFTAFARRAAAGDLPPYTFLEPDFSKTGNSQHPNYDVAKGEQLIRDVYYALRKNAEAWADTLLLITYDEHGGNYDHVPPPYGATSPDGLTGEFDSFDFGRFGVRIPAVLVSPRIAKGTVFRAATGTIDHTSVLKTLEERWSLDALTKRDQSAPCLGDAITLANPRTDDPLQKVQAPVSTASPPDSSAPSELEKIHALRVSQLPIPDAHGHYKHQPPTLSTSAAIHDYIEGRMALWDAHLAGKRRASSSAGGTQKAHRTKGKGPRKGAS
jgi:phospholipase C